jgi:small subunit ribosomal protein S21|tara:strand:+ start:97 stop:360 length:264 start_codon:yes stop_codon:yes gene_type:complete
MPSIDLTPKKRHPKDRRPPKAMPFDVALRKFRKSVERAGIIQEVRKREFYEKPAQRKQRKKAEARARWLKKQRQLELNGYEQPRRRK